MVTLQSSEFSDKIRIITSLVVRFGLRPQSVIHESHEARYGTISGLCTENISFGNTRKG